MLQDRKQNSLIKVITGIRRCGKSYLLSVLFYNQLRKDGVPEDHIIRFAFDSADDLFSIGEDIEQINDHQKKDNAKKFMTSFKRK